jgi:hypothetical protein
MRPYLAALQRVCWQQRWLWELLLQPLIDDLGLIQHKLQAAQRCLLTTPHKQLQAAGCSSSTP